MCYERRRAEACVDESAHHALLQALAFWFPLVKTLFTRAKNILRSSHDQKLHCASRVKNNVQALPPPGIEPRISCSVGRRLIHWATGASPINGP